MNRIEFMTKLASLLQDVPAEERREAMKYYNDYFDDAGIENEEQVIKELGSPEKIATMLKESISGYAGTEGEFTDAGYRDPKYEKQEVPESKVIRQQDNAEKKERWTSKPLKIILIVAIVLCAVPVIVPIIAGILAAVVGCILALAGVLIAIVIASIAVIISGIVILVMGVLHLFSEFAVGLALAGIGLILLPLGLIAVVASVKLCIVVVPGIIRGIVWLIRKPFHRKVVA